MSGWVGANLRTMLNADAALASNHFRATMFAVAWRDRSDTFVLSPLELNQMLRSGRWDLQAHAGPNGHYPLPNARPGAPVRAYYTNLASGPNTRTETLSAYRRRVSTDIDAASRLVTLVSGSRPVAFAYPFGETGGNGSGYSNDRRVPAQLRAIVAKRFPVAFVSYPPDIARRGGSPTSVPRITVFGSTRAETLYCFLRDRVESRAAATLNPRCRSLGVGGMKTLEGRRFE
ncbi:MAG: polysaccharide deacetylase family protein [Actinobacteria bacterium]|nr:polysaccharide deacetylase family protein [Actinomycetota bacterium]